jgi:hypothetical protein
MKFRIAYLLGLLVTMAVAQSIGLPVSPAGTKDQLAAVWSGPTALGGRSGTERDVSRFPAVILAQRNRRCPGFPSLRRGQE